MARRRSTTASSKSFRRLVQQQIQRDAKFAEALLREGIDAMRSGHPDTGKTILRLKEAATRARPS